ncbi:hypothetical protein [Kiloniella majae]|uniref:hypothetical protein n=1 Tax=Kiloniella majae TaxID=1938558 RepID=UPI000A277685|nr:hypothetical protein [Kiloniella majae]
MTETHLPLEMRTLVLKPELLTKGGRTLFVLCAYHGADHDSVEATGKSFYRKVMRRNPFLRVLNNFAFLRDFYANARDLDYLLSMVKDFVSLNTVDGEIALHFDAGFDLDASKDAISEITPTQPSQSNLLADDTWTSGYMSELAAGKFDTIILVYCDAIGLRCNKIDARVAKSSPSHKLLINGRRRVFKFDADLRGSLAKRRFLAHSHLGEFASAVAIVPVATALAVFDLISGRSSK